MFVQGTMISSTNENKSESYFIWDEDQLKKNHISQVGVSACGATAALNVLVSLGPLGSLSYPALLLITRLGMKISNIDLTEDLELFSYANYSGENPSIIPFIFDSYMSAIFYLGCGHYVYGCDHYIYGRSQI